MLISELIKELKLAVDYYGDVPVMCVARDGHLREVGHTEDYNDGKGVRVEA